MADTHVTIPMARLIELETAEHERDILRAEVEALRADAERYRWAREHGILSVPGWAVSPAMPHEWDAAIDAARAEAGPADMIPLEPEFARLLADNLPELCAPGPQAEQDAARAEAKGGDRG